MKVFITVGSTSFPELLSVILTKSFLTSLLQHGFYELYIQSGSTPIESLLSSPICPAQLQIIHFDYKDSLDTYFKTCDLVISHGGVGSLLTALRANKPALAILNDSLLDNHQFELASELKNQNYLKALTLFELPQFVKDELPTFLKDRRPLWPKGNPSLLHTLIDKEMGFSDLYEDFQVTFKTGTDYSKCSAANQKGLKSIYKPSKATIS